MHPTGSAACRVYRLLLALILVVAAVLRLGDFARPWTQQGWQHMGATFAIMARNYVEQGYLTTRLAPATNPEPPPDGRWDLFLHHPPFFPLLLSLSFQGFGVHEWSARLVPVLASLVELLAIAAIARRLFDPAFGPAASLAAAALAAVVPATAFYGSHVCELGPVVMAAVALAFALYLRHLEQPSRPLWLGILLALAFASGNDWPGVYLAGGLVLHTWWRGRRRAAASILAVGAGLLCLHLLHVGWATGDVLEGGRGGGLVHAFLLRTWFGIEHVGGPGVAIPAVGRNLVALYTAPVIALALLGASQYRRARAPGALGVLVLAGLAHTLVFGEGAARHDFWNVTMAPFLLVLAGAGAAWLGRAGHSPRSALLVQAAVVVVVGALAARETRARFQQSDSRFFATLGQVIAAHTQPGDLVTSCEFQADPMAYYARRRITNRITDDFVAGALRDGKFPGEPPRCVFVIPERKFDAHEHERLLQLLGELVEPVVVETEACGKVHVFDLVRGR